VVTIDLTDPIRNLGSDDLDVSEAAADLIATVGLAALPALDRAVSVESAAIRARAVEVAASVGERKAVTLLLRAASDAAPAVRAEALLGLGSIDDELGRRPVESALADSSIDVRRAAAVACATLCRSPSAFEQLTQLTLGEETTARMLVPRQSLRIALQGEGAGAARAAILSGAEPALSPSSSPPQRARAALLLADAGDPRASDLLAVALRSDVDEALRTQAVVALGATGDAGAVDVLRETLDAGTVSRPVVCRSLQDLAARGIQGAATLPAGCFDSPPN
jgi:HEAT repeat protein